MLLLLLLLLLAMDLFNQLADVDADGNAKNFVNTFADIDILIKNAIDDEDADDVAEGNQDVTDLAVKARVQIETIRAALSDVSSTNFLPDKVLDP